MQCLRASLLLASAFLVLSPSFARGSRGEDDEEEQLQPKHIWEDQLLLPSKGALNPHSWQVTRAAETALAYYNYQQGSPCALRIQRHVKKATLKTIPGVGRKYFLQFSTKDSQTGESLGSCLATVLYQREKPKPDVSVSCLHNKDKDQCLQEDYGMFLRIKADKSPSLGKLWGLATIGSSYITWEKATEDLSYVMKQIKNAKQWKRSVNSLEFDFTILLSNNFSETLSCHMRLIWNFGHPVNVKYDCATEEESSESADGSGSDMGSASGFFSESENNF